MNLPYFDKFNQMDYHTKITTNFIDEHKTKLIINIIGDIETFYTRLFIRCIFSLFENERGVKTIFLNFMKVTYMSSSGIASLLQIISRAKVYRIEIFFINLNEHMHNIIDSLGIGHFVKQINLKESKPIEIICSNCHQKVMIKKLGEFNCPHCNTRLSFSNLGAF